MDAVVNLVRRLIQARLFRRPDGDLSAWQVIGWWEARRLPYNAIVGATGLVTASILLVVAVITERVTGVPVGMPDPPVVAIIAVVAYGVGANLCYTGGWLVELLVARAWGNQAGAFGQIAFFLGVVFSVLATLLPAGLGTFIGAVNLVLHGLGYTTDSGARAE